MCRVCKPDRTIGPVGWGWREARRHSHVVLPCSSSPRPGRFWRAGRERGRKRSKWRLPDITAGRQQGTRSRQPPSHILHIALAHLCADKRQHIAVGPPLTADCHPDSDRRHATAPPSTRVPSRSTPPSVRHVRAAASAERRLVRLPSLPTAHLVSHIPPPLAPAPARAMSFAILVGQCAAMFFASILVGSLPLLFKAGIGCMCSLSGGQGADSSSSPRAQRRVRPRNGHPHRRGVDDYYPRVRCSTAQRTTLIATGEWKPSTLAPSTRRRTRSA